MPLSFTDSRSSLAFTLGGQLDAAAARRVLHGVAQQVGQHLNEPLRIGVQHERLRRQLTDSS